MKRSLLVVAILVCWNVVCWNVAAIAAETQPPSEDELAIRKAVASYVAAFNRGDAEALAAHWSEGGVYTSPSGERLQGHAAIRDGLAEYFAEAGKPRIQIEELSVRLLGAEVAVEEGKARVVLPGEPPTETNYIAIHVKQDGDWKLDSVRETAVPPAVPHYQRLRELEWMIGRWVDRSEEATVETVCQWTKNGNFITRSFKASVSGMDDLEGTQVIGWDPAGGAIRSWMFDSDGGFAEGTWSREADRWSVRTKHVLPDGKLATAVNVITRVDENTFTWESAQRRVGGRRLPDVEAFEVVRDTTQN